MSIWKYKTVNIKENGCEYLVELTYRCGQLSKEVWKNSNGTLHCINRPAVVLHDDGFAWWYQNGKLYRDDGPAFISPKQIVWYKHDYMHREDGPAIIYKNDYLINKHGKYRWYLNSLEYSKKQFLQIQGDKIINIKGIKYLKDGRKIKGL